MPHFLRMAIAVWLGLAATCFAQIVQVSSRLSSRFLTRGEQALLEVSMSGVQPTDFPVLPTVEGYTLRPAGRGAQTKLQPGRRLEYVFEYVVSGYDTGRHVIPSFELVSGNVRKRTEPVEFMIFNPDELKWSDAEVGGTRFRYATSFRVTNEKPYEGEATPVEIKLFVPRDLFVEDWGIPDFQRDGLTAWRFQPSPMRGEVNLLGMPYVSVAYPSTLTPNRKGAIGIGPATVRLVTTQVVMDGFLRRVSEEVHLAIPRLELESQPLPEGAPEGFENAVGTFTVDVKAAVTDVTEGDPIPLEITVSGSGNLDTLRPPTLMENDGWKVYEATNDQRGTERHELSGTTTFKQFIRPLELKNSVPPFRFVFFDPKGKTYQTVTTQPIPLMMKPAATTSAASVAPPEALPVPVERMTDILGLMSPSSLTVDAKSVLPGWTWHLLGALAALALVAKAVWMRIGHRFQRDPVKSAQLRELAGIENAKDGDDARFLVSVGAFIERWMGANPAPEIRTILNERDSMCFKPDKPQGSLLPPGRRAEILRLLRKATMALMAACLFCIGTSGARASDAGTAARAAYEEARYDEAIQLWLKAGPYDSLTADTLYNIGNACYRSGSPGQAALYYRRALTRDAGHAEARQNLRFIERKHGSITIHRPDYQYALARVPLATWKSTVWAGAWLGLLAALVFPATRPGARVRIVALAGLVFAPLVIACGALGWRYFPNDAEFAPLVRQAVITADEAVLHADASRTSPEVIDAPPGSLCEVIRESGNWAYVGFASKTRGWITTDSLEPVVPRKAPVPPKIRKPKVDGKSA